MVVPDGETAGDVLGEAAEMLAHALADRFERLEAGGARCGVDADALDRAMVDGDEHRRPGPSPVMVVVKSVPHIVSTVSGMMVPSWLRGPRCDPARDGASRSCSRMSRSTRRFEVRTPARRSLAQTLR